MQKMANRKVSSLVVTSFGNVVGILTERDIIKIIANGAPPDRIIISIPMSSPVVSIHSAMTMEGAARIMIQNKIRHLLVTQKGKESVSDRDIVGILSVTDFTRYLKQKISSSSATNDQNSIEKEESITLAAEVWELFF